MAKDTKFYVPEIKSIFGDENVSVKNNIIQAKKN